jgi:hypothetical protein
MPQQIAHLEAMAGTIREDLEEAQADWWQSLATRGCE